MMPGAMSSRASNIIRRARITLNVLDMSISYFLLELTKLISIGYLPWNAIRYCENESLEIH